MRNRLQIPTKRTVLSFGDQNIDAALIDFDLLYSIDGGQYGTVVAMGLKSHDKIQFAVKVVECCFYGLYSSNYPFR